MARHADFAEQLLAWRNKPEGPIEPVKTNWTVVPANDNNPEDIEGLRVEKRREMIPSVEAIMRSARSGDEEKNEAGQVVRIGALRFSDGKQTERAYCHGPEGKLVRYDAPMPVGAMLGTSEKAKVDAGISEDASEVTASNHYFADILDTAPFRHLPGSRNKKRGKSYSPAESAAILEDAWENTDPNKVTYTYGPAALPCGGAKVADSFVGMRKTGCADSGSIAWEDIATSMVNREMWMETIDALSKSDVDTLDYSMVARNMRSVGEQHGFVGKRAERMGKKILAAANDNLAVAMAAAA
jgi:hypothetical protein